MLIDKVQSALNLEKIMRDNTQRRARNAAMGFSNGRLAKPSGECVHDGCNLIGYDLTDELCSGHYVTDVLAEIEDVLHEANENWIACVHAESNAKEIWKCSCGNFLGTFEERERHFVAHDGELGHGPPVSNRLVQTTQTRPRAKNVTPSEGFFDE